MGVIVKLHHLLTHEVVPVSDNGNRVFRYSLVQIGGVTQFTGNFSDCGLEVCRDPSISYT